jgi:N-acyl homoserine lactone hydrolase
MMNLFSKFLISGMMVLLLGCSTSSHPLGNAAIGKISSSAALEQQIDQPGPIELESINSADWAVPLSGLINLNSPAALIAGLKDRDEPIQIYAHLIKHPQFGNYLIDTGVSQKTLDDPDMLGWLIRKGMHIEKMQIKMNTAQILKKIDGKLSGVFFTHLHIDHISGMPDIPNDVPLYIGQTESSEKYLINMMVHGASNQLLANKSALQEWHFQSDPQHKLSGVVDIFGDGSVFAISVPGHTSGSVAYLVRSTKGPVLLTGDTCHTRWGWEHGVEPGDFTRDNTQNLRSLLQLKSLVASHPQIEVRFGHQL